MSDPFIRLTGSAIVLLALPACALPPDYSPHYVEAPIVTTDKHHNKVVRYELAPEACLTPDPTDTQLKPYRFLNPCCRNRVGGIGPQGRRPESSDFPNSNRSPPPWTCS